MRDEEATLVRDLRVRANEEHLRTFPPDVARGYRAELNSPPAASRPGSVLVAAAEGRVVGTVTILDRDDGREHHHPWPTDCWVLRFLAVDPDARGRGLGRSLTQAAVGVARGQGARFVGLHTAPVMVTARRLYEHAGFRRAPEHDFDPVARYGDADDGETPPWGLALLLPLETTDGTRSRLRVELPSDATSPARAREAVRAACDDLAADVDAVVLCTSELVTNALLHGTPPIEVEVFVNTLAVRVEVRDANAQPVERRRTMTPDAASGRGLEIVEALARAWGSDTGPSGKVAWFEVSRQTSSAE